MQNIWIKSYRLIHAGFLGFCCRRTRLKMNFYTKISAFVNIFYVDKPANMDTDCDPVAKALVCLFIVCSTSWMNTGSSRKAAWRPWQWWLYKHLFPQSVFQTQHRLNGKLHISVINFNVCHSVTPEKVNEHNNSHLTFEWKLIVPFPTGVKSQMLADVSGSFVWCEEDNIELMWIVKASRCHCVRCVWSPEPSNLHQHIHKGTTADSLTLLPAPSFSPRICGSLHFAQ